ncbi:MULTISPECIES: helix-turn-helix domain-containing protein [Pseudonocardia]|uniref:Helix-turn-helix domain protein n=2 Tax=Pseudonocardia TaxID=1847 RepID=A0A1Y2N4I6_PSEAH|nr:MULTISPECIES: helix-turn-helix transcriptional regulator [Pseudonocardia]OSY42049.1 Helix-turn-helix domain protein [Pseudonocardia autotrophica]TDN75182.1 helix-turn-helix protein [Pseudonocardia autotrophica]BBF99127.1 transcriptional regulator [Pseudonocardia autotrophica]GEC24047.1 transcriptional regulator [Pseudonocardia saturnea]
MTVTHGPVVIRRRLGHVLKRLRSDRNLQLAEVARRLEISPSKLSRIETGAVEPKFRDVRDLLDIYEAPVEQRDRVLDWATEAKSPGWWQPLSAVVAGADLDLLLSLETEARAKRTFSIPVAGLLQTEAYARDLLAVTQPNLPAGEIERLVEIKMRRQDVIEPARTDAPPLDVHLVLDEVALHRVTDPEIARGQIRTLLARAAQPNVTLQLLPFTAGWTRATSTFSIFDPRDPDNDWPVVNVESTENDMYYDTEPTVASYEEVWRNVLANALDPEATRQELLDRLAD